MLPLLFHLIGDYVIQNDWMAQNKTKSNKAAAIHALSYAALFAFIAPSVAAWLVIFWTHFFIDRYRLATYWIRFWNRVPTEDAGPFGYSKGKPEYMSFWLMVIIDNTMHLSINHLALAYL